MTTYEATGGEELPDASIAANSDPIVGVAPDKAILVSPTGTINTGKPTYIWQKVTDSIYYCLQVNNSLDDVVVYQWFSADEFASTTTCSVTPSVTLAPGDHTWRIQTWNCDGGQWSDPKSFEVCSSTSLPGRATLISPWGTTGSSKPTYTWYPVTGATRYHLKVDGPSGNVVDEWYDEAEVLSGTLCSIKPDVSIGAGYHTWRVQTGNCLGDGLWSSAKMFKVSVTPPAKPYPLYPRGLISTRTPVFTWSAVPGATEYHLQIDGQSETIINETYLAEEVTSGNRCSVPSPIILPSDEMDFYWRVQASNDAGDGLWSGYRWFEPICGSSRRTSDSQRQEPIRRSR